MRIHLIAIGGAVMHNLAIALQENGHIVSGSDDEIYEPAKSRLSKHGLLPQEEGWKESNIHKDLDVVILGMHARIDNLELLKAKDLGLNIQSFPEFIYHQSKEKIRVVIAGSHGKTTTTSMLLHALLSNGWDFDYLVGAQIQGFETMVKLSDAPIIVIEGDEYLSSAMDRQPKFLHYAPHLLLITGIEWDHMNVFPTKKNYEDQFVKLLSNQNQNTTLFYYEDDERLKNICQEASAIEKKISYSAPEYHYTQQTAHVQINNKQYSLKVFGKHNLENMQGASLLAKQLGMGEEHFWESMQSFTGASKRMQIVEQPFPFTIIRDFAHAPSKVRATTKAVAEAYPDKKIIAVVELHTYSSLNKDFQIEYKGTLDNASIGLVFYSPHTLEMKKLNNLNPSELEKAFASTKVIAYDSINKLWAKVTELMNKGCVLLLMSSGNFENTNLEEWINIWGKQATLEP